MFVAEDIKNSNHFPFPDEGYSGQKNFEDFLSTPHMKALNVKQREADIAAMQEVTKRIREQVRFIVHSVRCWRDRHTDFDNSTRLRYSAYEGALCYTDLRRHWSYYRHAMNELKNAERSQ